MEAKIIIKRRYTCSECNEERLKYAIIDIDGTNLEEGYSCGNCGADFIGLDNEQVVAVNLEKVENKLK